MSQRYYSSTAVQTTLTAGCTGVDTTITVAATSGWPVQYPFVLILDENTASEELVLVSNVSGLTVTLSQRGYDGTAGQSHTLGATVRHGVSAADFRDSRTHEGSSTGVHGLSGAVVGTTDSQTLSNKTLAAPLVTGNFPVHTHTDTASGGTITSLTGHIAASTGVHGVTGAVVGTTDTQNLSNKTLITPLAQPATTANKGLLVKGLFGQTDNISEVQTSDGTPRWYVDGNGRVHFGVNAAVNTDAVVGAATITATAGDITAAAMLAQGANGQTGEVFRVVDFAGNELFTVDPVGLGVLGGLIVQDTAALLQAGLVATSTGAVSIPLKVQAAIGQTADLAQYLASDGTTVLARMDATGNLRAVNLPYAEAAGSEVYTFSSNQSLSHNISFPAGRFTQPPLITGTVSSALGAAIGSTVLTNSISTTNANLQLVLAGPTTNAITVHWRAVQMTSSSSAG